ncbi:protein snakeskin [Penaeus vannamei]|uniref:protein snakeskin n=1 Tax=Penaeus vannamei TaxID=6689 RepID=UPI00387F3B37
MAFPDLDTQVLLTPSGFLKVCETAMTILALSISQGIPGLGFGSESLDFFGGGTLVLSLVVSPLLLLTLLLGGQQIQKALFEMEVNFILAILMVVLGGLTIHTFSVQPGRSSPVADSGKAVGSMCLVNSVFYGLDTFFAYQNYRCA